MEYRPIDGPYHIQINAYNEGSRVYDVWASGAGEAPPPPPPPDPAPLILFVEDVGNDEGRQVRMKWQSSLSNTREPPACYRVCPLAQDRPAAGLDYVLSAPVPGPVPMYPPGDWDYLGTVPACCEETYATIVPTLADSTAA